MTTTDDASEDCLVLNVYTPAEAMNGNASLPVMVWIRITLTRLANKQMEEVTDLATDETTCPSFLTFRINLSLLWLSNTEYVILIS